MRAGTATARGTVHNSAGVSPQELGENSCRESSLALLGWFPMPGRPFPHPWPVPAPLCAPEQKLLSLSPGSRPAQGATAGLCWPVGVCGGSSASGTAATRTATPSLGHPNAAFAVLGAVGCPAERDVLGAHAAHHLSLP